MPVSSSVQIEPRGIYILGNDRVAGFLEPLFHSIRQYCPSIPVRLIPYNEQLNLTTALCERYGVVIHRDAAFDALENIGKKLWQTSPYSNHQNLFRRLCIFWGPFERFLYLDADICLLAEMDSLFSAFEQSTAEFASFDVDHERVYLPGPLREKMISQHGSLGFNSGHFFSRRGVFTLAEFESAAASARDVADEFQDRGDQGFLNYAVDTLGKSQIRMTSLVPELADKQWCEQKLRRECGEWHLARPAYTGAGTRLVMIHWSGYHTPGWRLPNRSIYYRFRRAAAPGLRSWLLPLTDFVSDYRDSLKSWFQQQRIALGRWRQSFAR